MKQEFIDWFISKKDDLGGNFCSSDRRYSYVNFLKDNVPFHQELNDYIFSLHSFTDTYFNIYHLHIWNEGDFFDEHVDNNFGRKWAYVCELQPSECNTSLIVNGTEFKEGVFDSNTPHFLPPITKGTRISLTVFGVPFKTLL